MNRIPVCTPLMGKREYQYVRNCLETNWISSSGKYIQEFEQNFSHYCGRKYGVTVTNGTAALHLAVAALGIGPGDEVIMPAFTIASTAFAVIYCGAKPVFVDSQPDTSRRLPDLVPLAKTLLIDARNGVELLPFTASHSAGDMAVYLPGSDIFFAGAVAFPDRSPYGRDADTGIWVEALNHLIRQGPRIVVPMRGSVQDVASLRLQRNSLAWLRGKIAEGMIDRLPIDEIRERVLEAEDIAERFGTDSPFLPILVEHVTQEAWDKWAKRRGQ